MDLPALENGFQSAHAHLLLSSFAQLLGRPLVTPATPQAMFEAGFPILSHNTAEDPLLTYGNRAALDLWDTSWDQLIGMPSRLTAEPMHRDARAAMFAQMRTKGFIENYEGVRISATGKRFRIKQAIIWPLIDAQGIKRGEAATFEQIDPL